jgi:hypothetical protein
MTSGRTGLRKLATLALACAGGVAAFAATPVTPEWSADPDEQFLLDVNIRQLKLGEGVRAYNTPQGTCVVLGDFLVTLDVPMKIDLAAKKASGWAFKEANRISIDLASGKAEYRDKSEPIAQGTVRETPEGWCVESGALARWFGIGVRPMTAGSVLLLESGTKLPVEMAIEREKRAARLATKAKFDINSLPQVKLAYRMWRAPALDFVVSAGVTYRANDGMRVDRQTSVYAAGEIAHLSYDVQASTSQKGVPNVLRLRAFRSDPEGGLLGPLNATHFGVGDVAGLETRLTGTSNSGRGAVVTNRPLFTPTSFDRTRLEGELPAGWEAELYRNGELLGFSKANAAQRYVFDDVQLLYGENRISIVLYGPQGQTRTREELINVGQDNVPAGKTWYWAGLNQPGRDLVNFREKTEDLSQPLAQAAVSVEHGLDDRTSVGMLARQMLLQDERLTFVEGSVRRSVGPAMVEVSGAYESGGGQAVRAQVIAKFGSVNVNAEAAVARNFHLRGQHYDRSQDVRLAVDGPIKIGKTDLSAHGSVQYSDRGIAGRQLEMAGRLAGNFHRFNLATDVRVRKTLLNSGPAPPNEIDWSLIGSGRVGNVRLRGSTTFDISPEKRFRSAELSAYWSASEKADWEGGLAYDASARRGIARISHVRRLESLALAVTGEVGSDGSAALGFNLNFSLDPNHGMRMSRQPVAASGALYARVYRDNNDNGVRDPGEPFEKGTLVTAGPRLAERPTDAKGAVMIGGLTAYVPITVGIDESSLSDPMLVPKKALQVIVPRPGVPAEVEIGLVSGGDVEGVLLRSNGSGFEGLAVELIDSNGKLVAKVMTDFDGFFMFERVAYGTYKLRLASESAEAARVRPDLNVQAAVNADRPVARLGSIFVQPLPSIASAK